MPINPSRSGNPVDPHNFGTYRYDAQNDVTNTNRQKHNNFRFNRSVLCTPRFGEITPFELLYCVPDDIHNFGNSVDLRTYTMKSPQFAGMKMHKDYYQVPLSSILPNTWQLWYKNPIKGDDVPDDVYPNWFLSPMPLFNAMTMILTGSDSGSSLSANTEIAGYQFFDFWYYLSVLYHVFSSGSLPCQLGIPSHRLFRFKYGTVTNSGSREELDYLYIDDYFERFFGSDFKMVIEFSVTSTYQYPIARYDLRDPADFRKWMNFCFSNFGLQIGESYDKIHKAVYCNVWYYKDEQTTLKTSIQLNQVVQTNSVLADLLLCPFQDNKIPIFFAEFSSNTPSVEKTFGVYVWGKEQEPSTNYSFLRSFNGNSFFTLSSISKNIDYVYDISPLIAYHQLCAQFFTVDAVDNIFDSKTWMQNMSSLITTASTSMSKPILFDFNGISVQYDIFSSRVLSEFLNINFAKIAQNVAQVYPSFEYTTSNYGNYRAFIYNFFSYEESLLYGDYFTGARLEPLAVGDVTVQVADNVNVVDIAKNDWKARFLNFINRTGSQIQDYIDGLFGVQPQQLDPLPKAIVHQEVSIQSYEVENQNFNPDATDPTQLQGYPVSLMRASAGSPQMSVIVTEPSFVIGVFSFEFRRFYDGVTDRQLFTRDRFDTFNPYLQNLGDQSIYSAEAFPFLSVDPEDPIAYQLRDTHYKQRVDVARGAFSKGFVKLLPSWARVVDLSDYVLDSEHIRNHNEDLDEFYTILSGNSLRSYFHFICLIQNFDNASRPMQAKPLLKF